MLQCIWNFLFSSENSAMVYVSDLFPILYADPAIRNRYPRAGLFTGYQVCLPGFPGSANRDRASPSHS
jgi:hypothetical protein